MTHPSNGCCEPLEHTPVWAGDGYFCSKCMLRFEPSHTKPLTNKCQRCIAGCLIPTGAGDPSNYKCPCECHDIPISEGWEVEAAVIYDGIHRVVTSERERIVGEIEGMRKSEDRLVRKSGNWDLAIGWNEALDAIKDKILGKEGNSPLKEAVKEAEKLVGRAIKELGKD